MGPVCFGDLFFRSKGNAFFRIGFQAGSLDQIDAVGDSGHHGVQAVSDGSWLTGQIDNERFAADSGDLSAEDGRWNFFEGDFSHEFTEAGENFVAHIERGFGSDIARGWTGSSGCDD